jgi:WD40 repeat protein
VSLTGPLDYGAQRHAKIFNFSIHHMKGTEQPKFCRWHSIENRRLCASSISQMWIWDIDTGEILRTLETSTGSKFSSITLSANGKLAASGHGDGIVRLWDLESPKTPKYVLEGHYGFVACVAISPDGQRIASASADETIRIWDIHTGSIIARIHALTKLCRPITPLPGFEDSAYAAQDNKVMVSSDNRVSEIRGHSGLIRSMACSFDGRKIATASDDSTVRVWDARTGTVLQTLPLPEEPVRLVAISPKANQVVLALYSNTVQVWDLPADTLQPAYRSLV